MSEKCEGLDAAVSSLTGWPLALVLVVIIAAVPVVLWVLTR